MKRITALLLAVVMLLGIGSAIADGWTCPNCGRTGNDSRFCPDCGTVKPEETEQTWTSSLNNMTDLKSEYSDYTVEPEVEVGEYVYFGHYEQDGDAGNGAEPIRWLVVDEDDGMLLLLSEKGLDRQRFNGRSNGEVWAGSELRKWLNGTFLRAAFDSDELDAIQITDVEDDRDHTNPEWNSANRFGGTTEDQIFLLSYQEMRSLVDSQDRFCEPSAATSRKGIYTENHNGHKCCWYWLRTSAYRNNVVVVAANGSFDTCYLHHEYGVVRPALWVDASAVTK